MSDQSFRDIEERLLAATNYGLDIIQRLYPQATDKKNFRIRDYEDDRNESASMKLLDGKNGLRAYRVTDFGGSVQAENAFGLYALDRNISYTEAVLELANDYQAQGHQILDTEKVIYKPEYRECKPEEFEGELNEKGFSFKTKDFTPFELGLLGPELKGNADNETGNFRTPLITPEVCKEVNLYSLEEFSFKTKDNAKVVTFRSTDKFPIMAFINTDEKIGQWMKVYMPRNGKRQREDGKDHRFMHVGGRPSNFIFGFDRLQKLLADYRISLLEKDKKLEPKDVEDKKLPRISIATGGSDGLNLIALGEPAVWFNSETGAENIDIYKLKELWKLADDIVNVPDCDSTGKREARKMALQHMDVRTLWLDTYFRNRHSKDFKDFCKENQSHTKKQLIKRVGEMMDATMPAKFWTSNYDEKRKRYTHQFSPSFAFYFLRLNGFCRVLDLTRKDGYYFAQVQGNVVEEVDVIIIKNFLKKFLIEKQRREGVREVSHSLMDALITTTRLSDSSMALLHERELDFTDFDQDAQYFFIGSRVYKTTKRGTEVASFDRYVLKSQLLDRLILDGSGHQIDADKFKVETRKEGETEVPVKYFDIKEIGPDSYDIDIYEKNCEFLNYMIQTSRVHWDKQRKGYIEAGYSEEDFYSRTKYDIGGKYLDELDIHEQKQHLVNKIFAFGYILHRYKDPSRPWAPVAVDESVLEDDVAEGGAGKTIFMDGAKYFCNLHILSGKEDFENDKFVFEGVSEHTDLLFFDDLKRNFDLSFFYQLITGDMTVNTKFLSKIKIPYKLSPKFLFTSNYSLKDQRGSSIRRRIVLGFSDYYHAENEDRGRREPKDDFGHSLYADWRDEQWFKFINFGFQCLQFYLGCQHKINAPANNILLRTYYQEMGEHFQKWADNYLPVRKGETLYEGVDYIIKEALYNEMIEYAKTEKIKFLADIRPTTFKKKLKAWCKINDFELEEKKINVLQYSNGQAILKDGKHWNKTTDHLRFVERISENAGAEPGEYY